MTMQASCAQQLRQNYRPPRRMPAWWQAFWRWL
jgi:hypothetical protein